MNVIKKLYRAQVLLLLAFLCPTLRERCFHGTFLRVPRFCWWFVWARVLL